MRIYITSNQIVYKALPFRVFLLALWYCISPATAYAFTCGPHMLTYTVHASDGSAASGVRCVKVYLSSSSGTASFDWYGEGNWGGGSYRHIGSGYTNHGEFGSLAKAVDIYGNGEAFNGFSTNLVPEVIAGSWPIPQEIRITGDWSEIWRIAKEIDYIALPLPITCGSHFTRYEVSDLTGVRQGDGLRCVVSLGADFYLWFGTGQWDGAQYTHIGHLNVRPNTGPGTGQAVDLCEPQITHSCSDFPASSLMVTPVADRFEITGAWNELWGVADLTVLTINLKGIENYPSGSTLGSWQARYLRIADWMAETKKLPDVIALQEVLGFHWCFFSALPDYETLYDLISKIKNSTGITYRIAYHVGGPIPTGLCSTWSGLALLYNPDRLYNATGDTEDISVPRAHDDMSTEGIHLRRSLPCCNPEASHVEVCNWIDEPKQYDKCNRETRAGPAWVGQAKINGRSSIGPAFTRFRVRAKPSKYFHIHNIHINLNDYHTSINAANNLIGKLEDRFTDDRLFPPIIVGDLNMTSDDAPSAFPTFKIIGYTPSPDVIGVLVGNDNIFPSKYAGASETIIVRTGNTCDSSLPSEVLWSDHCSIFARFRPE